MAAVRGETSKWDGGTDVFDLDRGAIDFPCPSCGFYNPAFLKQVRLRDVLICRGCKCNIQLDDHMNELRVARRRIRESLGHLSDAIKGASTTIEIKL